MPSSTTDGDYRNPPNGIRPNDSSTRLKHGPRFVTSPPLSPTDALGTVLLRCSLAISPDEGKKLSYDGWAPR